MERSQEQVEKAIAETEVNAVASLCAKCGMVELTDDDSIACFCIPSADELMEGMVHISTTYLQ